MAAIPRLRAFDLQRLAAALLICASLLSCSKDEEGCQVRIDGEGARFLVCTDGSRVPLGTLPDTEIPHGIARGQARLFGRAEHDSITVLMRRTDGFWSTSTRVDPDGSWELDAPAGLYDFEYSAPGYDSVSAKSLPVAPGVSHPAAVELRCRFQILDKAPSRMIVLPDESGLLMFDGEPGPLALWRFGGALSTVSTNAAWVQFTPATNRIAFLDGFDAVAGTGTLTIHDPANGARTTVAEEVRTWTMSDDESVVAAEQDGSKLVVWKEGAGLSVVGDDVVSWSLAPSGRTLLFRTLVPGGNSMLVQWDVPAAGGSALSATWGPVFFSPEGESFIYSSDSGESVLWDGLRHRAVLLGWPMSFADPVFGPDGQWLVFPSLREGTLLFDLASPVPATLDGPPDFWLFSEEGDALYYGSTQTGRLTRRTLQTGATTGIADGSRISVPVFAGDDRERWLVFSFQPKDSEVVQLVGWTRAGGVQVLATPIEGEWAIAPDARSVAFFQEGRLFTVELATGARTAAGDADVELKPRWQGPEVVLFGTPDGTYAVHDRIRGSTTSLGDEVSLATCRSGPDGSTSCLARESPNQGGSELVRWDRAADRTATVTDGILDLRTSLDGGRMALISRALPDTAENLLVLFDPTLGAPVPLDDQVVDFVIAPRWVAWAGLQGDDEDAHLYFTPFPAEHP